MTFAEKLVDLLDERECTFAELAEAIGLQERSVKRWLQPSFRYRMPHYETIVNICKVMEVDTNYFDECFDDDYARLRSDNRRQIYTGWDGEKEEEDD